MIRPRVTHNGTRHRLLFTLALIALAACAVNAGERQHCLRAEIDQNFVLPDGSVHPPGELRLCLIRSMSPISSAHHTHVDGHSVGYFMSVKTNFATADPGFAAAPYFEFVRNWHGELELRGYAVTDGTTMLAYDLTKLNKKKYRYRVTTREEMAAAATPLRPEEQEGSIIHLTASRH
jgi:hypothetical protein